MSVDIKPIIEHLASARVDGSLSTREAKVIAGFESADEYTGELAAKVENELDITIRESFESANVDIKDYQLELAKEAAVLAVNPIDSLKAIMNSSHAPKVELGAEAVNIDAANIFDADTIEPALEAFDSENVKPNVNYAVVLTALGAKQDEGADLLFPVIPINANSSGATVSATVTSVIKDFLRGTTGELNADKFKKKPLVKIINNPDEIDVDKNRLVPVLRTGVNDDKFVSSLSHVVNYNGEEVNTAPVKVGSRVNLLELGQTDQMLAKGQMDITDALDARVKVGNIYYELTGDDGDGNTITETFKFDLDAKDVTFTYSTTQHNKDIILNIKLKDLIINTTETRTATGSVSKILSNLPEGYTVGIELVLTGTGNVQSGDVGVYASEWRLLEVRNPAGQVVNSGSDYDSIKDVIDTLNVIGWDPEAYITNSNARMRGLILTTDKYTAVYSVPFRTNYTTILPVVSNGDDGDLQALTGAINVARWKMNAAAYKTLTRFIDYLRNTGDNAEVKGVSNLFVNKYFVDETLDLANIVDSISSSARLEDIRNALILKIKNAAIQAYLQSNYGVALDATMPGTKPTIIIVTDPVIGMFLYGENGIASDNIFDYKIATSVNPLIRGKIVFTFGIMQNRNKEPNPFNFGQCFVAPGLTVPVMKSVNGRVALETTVMSRFLHTINLPIVAVYNITNIETVLGKVHINTLTV